MDPSNNNSIGAAHLQQREPDSGYPDFLSVIHNYAGASDQSAGNDDLREYFDPALFDSQDVTSTNQQLHQHPQQPTQQQNFQSAFTQHAARQSHSPALPAYNPGQHNFTQQPPFSQPVYDPRAAIYQNQQQNFDPRFYQRPSQSPAPVDQLTYPPSNFQSQTYQQPQMGVQQRASNTPGPAFPNHQANYSPFINFSSRDSAHMQTQTPQMLPFNTFQESNQKSSHTFVDPSILNANHNSYLNGQYPQSSQRPIQSSHYFHQGGSTIDPRSLGQSVQQSTQPYGIQPSTDLQQQPGAMFRLESDLGPKQTTTKDANVSKKSKGNSQKFGLIPKQGGQGSASRSDSGSDVSVEEEEEPEKTPTLLSVQMPTDERGMAMYRAVQAVWSPRNLSAPVEKIKSGLVQFGDTIKGLRDSWKEKNEILKKAELPNSATAATAPQLKAEVAHYRTIVEIVVNRSLQHAHPAILKRLGENQWTMSALYAFMLDRVTVGDHDSSLIIGILKLAVNFDTLDEEKLEATKWPKLLQRLSKKATTDSKHLAQTILNNATTATAKKKALAKADHTTNGDTTAGVKRGRNGEPLSQSAAKKAIAKASSKPLALQNAERRQALEVAEAAKKTGKAASSVNGGTTTGPGQKAKIVVTQPPKVPTFASLMSASKRPGTSNAERAAAAKEKPSPVPQQIKKEVTKKDSPPPNAVTVGESKATSSLMGFLSALEKKEEAKPAKVEEPANETAEQKEKRRRKESRRKLRVSWKADSEMVETRWFTHDPDEEVGHSESSMRDAGDTMKEGEMLKRHKGMDDLEDEEEVEEEAEVELPVEYMMPTEVDFSEIEEVLVFNGVKLGGPVQPTSPSSEAQDMLETNTVMVVFASQADRPESPKEPADEAEDADFQPCVDFGEVPAEIRKKESEVQARLSRSTTANLQGPGAKVDLSQILGMLKPQAAPAPQATPAGQYDLQKLVASVAQISQHMQGQGQGQSSYQPQATLAPPAGASAANLSSLLASFQQAAASQGGSLPLGAGGNPNPFPGAEKHGLDPGEYGQPKAGKKKKGNPPKATEGGLPANYKTQTCQFWLEGKCNKGDHCTYRHDRIAS